MTGSYNVVLPNKSIFVFIIFNISTNRKIVMTDQKTTILELKELVREFVNEREWNQYHNAKNLSMAISVEASELMEELLWESSENVSEVVKKKEKTLKMR